MRLRHTAALVGVLCVTVTGCTTISPGEATPATTSESSTAGSTSSSGDEGDLPSDGAPKVKDPLDTTRFEQDPCSSLSTKQAQDLNLPTNGKQEEIPYGVGCEWRN